MDKTQFTGPGGGYIVATWNESSARWQYRPVTGGPPLTDAEIAELGLDAPLVIPAQYAPKAFSQRDPQWASVRLGSSLYTMGGAGCAVTACAMVASTVKPDITPLDLVNWLNTNNGFTSGGLLYWSKVADCVSGLSFAGYHLWRDVAADLDKLKRALLLHPQVIQVDFHPATAALDSHFVTAVSFTADGADLNIIDPWTGQTGALLKLYSKAGWTLSRAIYALAEFAYS